MELLLEWTWFLGENIFMAYLIPEKCLEHSVLKENKTEHPHPHFLRKLWFYLTLYMTKIIKLWFLSSMKIREIL